MIQLGEFVRDLIIYKKVTLGIFIVKSRVRYPFGSDHND